jgi:hypothetical protein
MIWKGILVGWSPPKSRPTHASSQQTITPSDRHGGLRQGERKGRGRPPDLHLQERSCQTYQLQRVTHKGETPEHQVRWTGHRDQPDQRQPGRTPRRPIQGSLFSVSLRPPVV